MNRKNIPDNHIVFYQSQDGNVHLEVMYAEENIWLNQKTMAELFGVQRPAITKHLKNIFESGELDEKVVSSILEHTTQHGAIQGKTQIKNVKFYNLEAIISVGYRVNSDRGREFRTWATTILKNYIHKGYALDSDRMKYGSRFSTRYFDELYEEIKDIRTSERMIYQKITDIYATSFDYSPNSSKTKEFFATVQNKLHFSITGKTAAEIVANRADSKKEKMGLTAWRKSPKGKIMPSDVVIAKNYLAKTELKNLNRIGNMYLDFAELQAARGKVMMMKDWIDKLDAFLKFSEYEILTNTGKISHEIAKELALKEYQNFKPKQDKNYISDFDREVKKLLNNKKSDKNEK
ncbi:MAG: virulence RhuM family protein [Candidatus Marinimicrobia bacterium]|nr:virulence RhuM family protein [Candidatus Neomarinimicrobiota bacterium]